MSDPDVEVISTSASRVSALDRLIERPFFRRFTRKKRSRRGLAVGTGHDRLKKGKANGSL